MFLAWKRLTPFERVGIRDAGWLSSQSPLMPETLWARGLNHRPWELRLAQRAGYWVCILLSL